MSFWIIFIVGLLLLCVLVMKYIFANELFEETFIWFAWGFLLLFFIAAGILSSLNKRGRLWQNAANPSPAFQAQATQSVQSQRLLND